MLQYGKKASAIIFRNNLDHGMYFPVVRFLTDEEEWITQQLNVGFKPPKREGTKLEVIYDPNDPTQVEIDSSFYLQTLPVVFMIGGIIMMILGFLQLFDLFILFES